MDIQQILSRYAEAVENRVRADIGMNETWDCDRHARLARANNEFAAAEDDALAALVDPRRRRTP